MSRSLELLELLAITAGGAGAPGPAGARGRDGNPAALPRPWGNTAYVSATGNDDTATGAPWAPFKTIQAAVDAVCAAPTSKAEYETPVTLFLVGPANFVENVTINARINVRLELQGKVRIQGKITFRARDTLRFASTIYPTLSVVGVGMSNTSSIGGATFDIYDTAAFRLGDGTDAITVDASGADLVSWSAVYVGNLSVEGAITRTNAVAMGGWIVEDNCYHFPDVGTAAITWPQGGGNDTGGWLYGVNTTYQGTISVEVVGEHAFSQFARNVTVQRAINVQGLRQCDFSGARTWTGPAGSLSLDAYGQAAIRNAGWTLAGGATFTRRDGSARVQSTSATETQIAANTNDWAISLAASRHRVSSDAARNVTGIAGGVDGLECVLMNVGAQTITLKHQDAASAAANRIIGVAGADVSLVANGSVTLCYDGTTARWRCLAVTA